jgi:transcriptional regulator of acetoin/glycerol metabolism
MTTTTIEMHKYLISYLGEEKIIELSTLFGNERISFASVKKFIKSRKISQEVIKQRSVKKAANLIGVHRSTIYRQLKKSNN